MIRRPPRFTRTDPLYPDTTLFRTEGLSVDGGLSYIDFNYTDVGRSGLTGDEVTPYTPKWTYSFGIQYDQKIDPGTIGLRFDGSYQGTIYSEAFKDRKSTRLNSSH